MCILPMLGSVNWVWLEHSGCWPTCSWRLRSISLVYIPIELWALWEWVWQVRVNFPLFMAFRHLPFFSFRFSMPVVVRKQLTNWSYSKCQTSADDPHICRIVQLDNNRDECIWHTVDADWRGLVCYRRFTRTCETYSVVVSPWRNLNSFQFSSQRLAYWSPGYVNLTLRSLYLDRLLYYDKGHGNQFETGVWLTSAYLAERKMYMISGAAEILSELDISLYLFISLLSTVLPIAIRAVV